MANRTALKVGAAVVGAALLYLLVQTLLGWVFRLATMFGVALLVVGLAYVGYRVWTASSESERATEDGRGVSTEPPVGDGLDVGSDVDRQADASEESLSDEEFERELEKLRD